MNKLKLVLDHPKVGDLLDNIRHLTVETFIRDYQSVTKFYLWVELHRGYPEVVQIPLRSAEWIFGFPSVRSGDILEKLGQFDLYEDSKRVYVCAVFHFVDLDGKKETYEISIFDENLEQDKDVFIPNV